MAERLFASVYLDEDVDVLVARLLDARAFQVTTARSAGRLGASDEAQLAHAAAAGAVLVTHNRVDFERLATRHAEQGRAHAGIVIAHRRSAYEVARRLLILLNAYTPEELANTLRYA